MYQSKTLFLLSVLALCGSTVASADCGGVTLDGYNVALKPYALKNDGVVGFGPDNMYDYTGGAQTAWQTAPHPSHRQHSATESIDVYGTSGKIGRATAIVAWPYDPNVTRLLGFFAATCYEWCEANGFNHITFLIYMSNTYKGSVILTATKQICETC